MADMGPQKEDMISAVCGQLPGPWAALCRSKHSTTFAWAHDGVKANGSWVELSPDGKLATKWGTGSWDCDDCEPVVLKLTFGASCHVCRLIVDEGNFQVEKRLRRGGQIAPNPKIKGVEVVSAGWPIEPSALQGKQKPNEPAEKTLRVKLKAAEVAQEKMKAAEEAAASAAEAAAEATAKATEMEKLAKKAEAVRSKAVLLAEQTRKEADAALAEHETAGLGRFGFVTPQSKRTKDAIEEDSSPPTEKRARLPDID